MSGIILCGYSTEGHKDPCTHPKGHECPHWYQPRERKGGEKVGPKLTLRQLRGILAQIRAEQEQGDKDDN